MKRGDEYKGFIQSCHIGLSTQNPEKGFNDTSFPSKVLSYMVNGLQVVSVEIPVLTSSGVNTMISYCADNSGKEVAGAILKTDITKQGFGEEIQTLHKAFKDEMKEITEDVK